MMRIPKGVVEQAIGAYSEGSLRPADLLDGTREAVATLHALIVRSLPPDRQPYIKGLLRVVEEATPEELDGIIEQVNDLLPEGYYLGSAEGDPALFGIWREVE